MWPPGECAPHTVLSAEMWGQSQDGRLLCGLGAEAFLGSVRPWSCLEAGSLTTARRPELVPTPTGAFPGPGYRWRVSLTWAASLFPSPWRLSSQRASSSQHYLFFRLECVGLVSLVASCCRLAKQILAAEMFLSCWRSSPAVVHVLSAWSTSAGDAMPGIDMASAQGL